MHVYDCSSLFDDSSSSSRWSAVTNKFEQCIVDDKESITAVCSNYVAVAVGSILTITSRMGNTSEKEDSASCDIEFDEGIEAMCWSGNGNSCSLIVGDQKGCLHFLTSDGDVLFAHGLLGSK